MVAQDGMVGNGAKQQKIHHEPQKTRSNRIGKPVLGGCRKNGGSTGGKGVRVLGSKGSPRHFLLSTIPAEDNVALDCV